MRTGWPGPHHATPPVEGPRTAPDVPDVRTGSSISLTQLTVTVAVAAGLVGVLTL
ncbi:hypothetical protein ACFVZW_35155 [Streptomyces sp. NPDC059567]|uniref:hypothetical protein n=1 Tax=Streptomyces sp. NPDC059567 TaxID=3346867 RepID=UPI00367DEADB